MFGIAPSELLIVALVAIVLIGPKDLPRVMRAAGQWLKRGAAMKRQMLNVVEDLMKEVEIRDPQPLEPLTSRVPNEGASPAEDANQPGTTVIKNLRPEAA